MKARLMKLECDHSRGCELTPAEAHRFGQVWSSRARRAAQRHQRASRLVSLVTSDCVTAGSERHGLRSQLDGCLLNLRRKLEGLASIGHRTRKKLSLCRSRSAFRCISLHERARIGAVAGAFAGGFTHAALHPIDTVKTKLQTRGASALYSGPLDVVRKVFASQGVKGFYSGAIAATYGSMLSSAVYFGVYELGKGMLLNVQGMPRSIIPPLSAAFGNVMSSAILVPKEVIKQRMQAGGAIGTSWEVLRRTLAAEGIGGLYVGYSAALLRNLPTNVINFTAYESLRGVWLQQQQQQERRRRRRHRQKKRGRRKLFTEELSSSTSSSSPIAAAAGGHDMDEEEDEEEGEEEDQETSEQAVEMLAPWQSAVCGALSGALSSGLTTPLDVAKTRIMTQARTAAAATTAAQPLTPPGAAAATRTTTTTAAAVRMQVHVSFTYSGVASTLQRVWVEEGCGGLMRGVGPRLVYGAAFSALGFAAFETFKAVMLLQHLESTGTGPGTGTGSGAAGMGGDDGGRQQQTSAPEREAAEGPSTSTSTSTTTTTGT